MKIGEEYSTNSKNMAKHFNKYFGTIAKNIENRTQKSKKKIFRLFKKSKLNFISPKPCYRKKLYSNHKPISLLPSISKIIQKAMYTRLYKFLEKYKCPYKIQFRFKKLTLHSPCFNKYNRKNQEIS